MIEIIAEATMVTSVVIISSMCGQFVGWIISEICIYIENQIKKRIRKGE